MTVEEALKLAVQYRALSIKCEGIEVVLSPLAFVQAEPATPEERTSGARELTDMEILMWSSGGDLPDVEAKPPEEDA